MALAGSLPAPKLTARLRLASPPRDLALEPAERVDLAPPRRARKKSSGAVLALRRSGFNLTERLPAGIARDLWELRSWSLALAQAISLRGNLASPAKRMPSGFISKVPPLVSAQQK